MSKKKTSLGEVINFRNLVHAPVNELGVVFLFGLLHESLELKVECIQNQYPDCIAKRKLSNGRWQQLRIEFEYESRNFIAHRHDPRQVDMIVCWIHNCPTLPDHIEIVELKSLIVEPDFEIKPAPIIKNLNDWQKFCQQKRKEGLSFKEISKMWKRKKGLE